MTDYEPQRGRQTSGRSSQQSRSDYIEVKDRVVEFYTLYPEGRIVPRLVKDDEQESVVYVEVFRNSDPTTPPAGAGHSSLSKPGKTNYTRDSELENAETSAVGRALAFAGISAHRGIASMSEILSKRGEEPAPRVNDREGTKEPRGDAGPPDTATETSATPEGKESTSRVSRKPKERPQPEPDPALVDPETGEVVGLTQEQFGEALADHYIVVRVAQQVFERLYPGVNRADATPAMRLATLNAAVADIEAAESAKDV